ncbi:MAG: glycosyltransferase [Candidatus Iainarchaeum archaeon]|uniref:Glycosyltransferase n=1 Tax=Candidatus Iainarchaeum sp. TaxID=3101447 RepID=A0A7T9DKC5_9ARCH|nr:MAG: glycosyltransferase [Candidatus Diapherotrites archaeon]
MRIAIFTDSFWPQINGVTTAIWNYCVPLADEGHEFIIFAPKPAGSVAEAPAHKNIQTIWLPSFPLPSYKDYLVAYHLPSAAKKKLNEFAPEIVHVHTPFFVAKQGLDYAKKHHLPSVGTFHTLLTEFLEYLPLPVKELKRSPIMEKLTWKYMQHFYSKCKVLTTPSTANAHELQQHGFKHVQVLTNGIDYTLFAKTKPKKSTKKETKLLYYGRISFEKRIDIVVDAFARVHEQFPHTTLTIIGSGPAENALKAQTHALGIASAVHFPGAFRGKELAERVQQHDIMVTASPMETQGLTVLEAMAAGLAVVGADARAIPLAIGNNERGLLFKEGDAIDCATQLEKLLYHPALRKKLIAAGKKFSKHYDKKTVAKQLLKLYHSSLHHA